jgi:hypothetical protein
MQINLTSTELINGSGDFRWLRFASLVPKVPAIVYRYTHV